MILSLGELAPDIAANVGSISSVLVMALLAVFAGIFPGQRTTQGTLMPPSSVRPLRPLKGKLLPCFSLAEPLSEVNSTKVFSSIPNSLMVLNISPIDQSTSFTQSP